MFLDILTQFELSKNEAQIFECLVKRGPSSVSDISKETNIHRRNIYDTLNHLLDKGLVYEIFSGKENKYHAVSPNKLKERLREKETLLDEILPALNSLYNVTPPEEAVFIYKGLEGWKNYLQDVLDIGEPLYTIGGKGAWADPKLHPFLDHFIKESKKKNILFHALYDGDESEISQKVLANTIGRHKFLPKKYSNSSVIEVFGNRVVIFSNIENRQIDNNATLTVIINQKVADSHRTWFQMIWDLLP